MTGEELAARREKCGLTQGQLAGYLAIGRTSVWRLETGREPIGRAIESLAQTLEPGSATLEDWLDLVPAKKQQMIRRRQHKHNLQIASGKS